jgi:hypothetical protein
MDYFLFAGTTNVGKTEAVGRLARYLLGRGFQNPQNNVPRANNPQTDFCALLTGMNLARKRIRVIVNSNADIDQHIDDLVSFCQTNAPYDIIISAIRCDGFSVRNYFYTRLGINVQTDNVTELPMAAISARYTNYITMRQWYRDRIDNIAYFFLASPPFLI